MPTVAPENCVSPVEKTEQHEQIVRTDLFPRAFPNLRVFFFPFSFLGYWLRRKLRSQDATAPQAQTLVKDIMFGEAPRFRMASRELYFSDVHGQQVLKYSLSLRKKELVYEDPEDMVSGLGWLPDGRMLIVSMNTRRVVVYDERTSSIDTYADVKRVTRFRANDMVVSTSGHVYVGSFGFDMANVAAFSSSAIASVNVDGDVRVEAPNMIFPNGMVITPDGKALIAAETFAGRLTVFDIGADGRLSNRRVWANVGSFVDGICLDAEGCVWVSICQSGVYPTGGGLLRVQEGGRIMDVLGFGANGIKESVFACQLGTDAEGQHHLFFMEAVTSYDHLIFKHGKGAAMKNGLVRSIEHAPNPQPDQEQDPSTAQLLGTTKTKQQQELFQKVAPNVRMLYFPFRFLGYWLSRRLWSENANAPKARTLLDDIVYGEGPRFRIPSGELYFTDMHDHKVIKYELASGKRSLVYDDPEDMLSGLGWLLDGRLLISSMNKRQVLIHDEASHTTEVYADVKDVTQVRANDMVVATSGRAYLGSFGFHNTDLKSVASSAIVSIGLDGAVRVEATGLVFPNGMVITPDGKTLIVGETFEGRLTAYDVGDDGRLTNGRLWADVGSPIDGICLDAEGCIWASIVQPGLYQMGGGLVRLKEGGEILDVLGFGANGITNSVFACQLGTDTDGKHQLFFMESVTSYDHVIFKDGPEAARKNCLVSTLQLEQQLELFPKAFHNVRMLIFPFHLLGYLLGWSEDPNSLHARTHARYSTISSMAKVIRYTLASGERTLVYNNPEDILSGLGWFEWKPRNVGVVFSNAIVITPDGETLIASEVFEGRLTAIVQSGLYQTGGGLVRVKVGGEIMGVVGFGANGIVKSMFVCQLDTDANGKRQLFFMEAATPYDHLIFKEAGRKNGLLRTIEVKVGPSRIADDDNYCGGYC
ncbi:hypothetical protein G195_003367 [Phytophthora kernoviae 00238/432]|uniref:SMP-30/Gluconolactonase/LRE-like region domain-containing protein n=1 Tax=Phytophthora kernoviae 00238/432 TaxID=1284355 RepID=A0A8J4SB79_9STRA|nr:hypothetical protein G195_003367 [Phytophthora kernoviae 00238/432]